MNRYDDEEYPERPTTRITPPERSEPSITRRLSGPRRPHDAGLPPSSPADNNTRRIDETQRRITAHPDGVGYAKSLICPECNGDMVWAHTSLYLRPGVSLGVTPWFSSVFKSARGSELNALVCGNCGFTRLYAAEPRRLTE